MTDFCCGKCLRPRAFCRQFISGPYCECSNPRSEEIDHLQHDISKAVETTSKMADTIIKQDERIDHLTAELSDLRMSHSRLVSACKNLTGSLWPQNETTEKLREIIGELEGE